ncbi:hypothetical protein GSI_03051 [Ganoderma sinense ZZ0214-1]|uniref:Uncharacterized protein n=1 Tax=Ganoderma sinense ZZ0214-1 TaxID=1077348 RepID=A0A2G8SKI4_9APHY|nr:hypothetical protein GSI_03051 [Ganoderma sinense ZZ0214-1]
MPRPEASTARKRGRTASCSPLRGTASLLVLLELDSTLPCADDNTDSVGGRTVTEAQTRDFVAIERRAPCQPKNSTAAPSKVTSEFDEDECLVDLNLSSSLSDVTLYDVVEADDSEGFSVGVEIEEASETQKRMSVYHKEPVPVSRHVHHISTVPSIDTEYSSVSHFHTATSSSCSTATTSTTDSKRRALPWRLYEDLSSAALELHLFPSPFHPQPLVPLLCVGDEQNIVPLMCSTLHQCRALGRADVPVVGILLPGSGSTCEVLFGWIEKGPRPGRTLAKIHICARGLSSRIPTVFDLERPYSALCLVRFLAGLGAQAEQLRVGSQREAGSRDRASLGQGWRADTHFRAGFRASCDESEARIRLWTYEVGCCNQVQEEDDFTAGEGHEIIPRASQSSRMHQRYSDNEQLVKLLRQNVADLFVVGLSKATRRSRSPVSTRENRKTPCERSTNTQSVSGMKDNIRGERRQAGGTAKDDSRVVSWCSSCSDGSDDWDTDALWQRAYNALAFWS